MEWKNAKKSLSENRQAKGKQKLTATMNTIPSKKSKQASNHKKILTQGGQSMLHSRPFTSSPCYAFKENLKTKEQQCSTFAHSFHSIGHQLKLSQEFTKISRQLEFQNCRMKALLANFSKACTKPAIVLAQQPPKMSLLDKIKYQSSIVGSMKCLNPCR